MVTILADMDILASCLIVHMKNSVAPFNLLLLTNNTITQL